MSVLFDFFLPSEIMGPWFAVFHLGWKQPNGQAILQKSLQSGHKVWMSEVKTMANPEGYMDVWANSQPTHYEQNILTFTNGDSHMSRGMKPVGDWVAEDYSKARLFETLGIDFCCGGKKSLKQACEENGLYLDVVLEQIAAWDRARNASESGTTNPAALSSAALCDHIEQTHHKYLREHLPYIHGLLKRVVAAHGESYRPLLDRYEGFIKELAAHMEQEERVVFPAIRQHKEVAHECLLLEKEHDEAGEALRFFREFTQNYTIPERACNTHRTAILELEALEKDMHLHVYKENHLLFPKK